MVQTPSRKFNVVSDNTKRILANLSKSVLPQKIATVSSSNKIALDEALASGRFTADKFGLFKEADNGADLGRIWVKKRIKEANGEEKEWLVVYTNDEDEIIRQLASNTLKATSLQKTAAPKQPNPKDVPIAPGIKSKNITMDESGATGTAKVTVEFTDTDQALNFYQDQGQPQQKEAPAEEKPAEGGEKGEGEGEGEGKAPANVQPGNVPPVPPIPQTAPAGQKMTNLRPTIKQMSSFGQQVAYVIATEEDKQEETEKKESSQITYSFINEQQQEITLPWNSPLRIGSIFERPDTGQAIRVAGYIQRKLTPISNLINELVVLAKKPYYCETCNTGFTEGQMNFHKSHTYKKSDGEEEPTESDEKEKDDNEKKASLELIQKQGADISDEIPPMGWQTQEGKNNPVGAGAALPPQQNLQNQEQPQNQSQNPVLYDSNQDEGPQFQTTINPKDKSVTVKFVNSPEQQALQEAVNTSKPVPPLAPPQQTPAPPQAAPGAQTPPAGGNFEQQNVPVTF